MPRPLVQHGADGYEKHSADEIAAAVAGGACKESARQYVALREVHTVYADGGAEGNRDDAANTEA